MILEINHKKYRLTRLDELNLKHAMQLQAELAAHPTLTRARTWLEVRTLWQEYSSLPEQDRETHPETLFLAALTVWATRVVAGEQLSLMEAIDVPVRSIRFLEALPDHQPKAGKGKRRGR